MRKIVRNDIDEKNLDYTNKAIIMYHPDDDDNDLTYIRARHIINAAIAFDFDILWLTHTVNRLLLTTGTLGNGYINLNTSGNISYGAAGGDAAGLVNSSISMVRATFVNDGSIIKAYNDGIQQVDTGTAGSTAEVNAAIYIGSSAGINQFHYGHIKKLKIYEIPTDISLLAL